MTAIPTIAEAAAAIAKKDLSPVELTKACLDRVKAQEPTLHAFVTLTEDRALADAAKAEAEIMANGPKGPMHGIPIGLKDIVDTKGILTTCCSAQLAENVPDTDATCAVKLDAAGTVLVGKLTTHEFADGGPSFDLPWPVSRNPWNPDHFTAGSSSGTGAAVASGMILGGIGTDTGGSIRGPSSLCGIAGIKPTYGLVSRAGVAPAAFSLDHIGPMCWTAEDCALMLQALAGHDPRDPASAANPVPDYTAELPKGGKGLRIGLVRHFHEDDHKVSEATQKAIDAAVKLYADMGAEVVEVTLSPMQDFHAAGFMISATERLAAYETMATQTPEKFGQRYRDRMILGSFVTGADYVQALRMRRELTVEVVTKMAGIDVLLTAANPGEAPKIDALPRFENLKKPSFTMPFNLTGLPLGLQLVAKPFEEAVLFRAAHAYEQATEWRKRRPEPAMAVAA
jgi:aspartyl-tRNA(Asn)/glutamyl-tRNA(Gln) amidotransferase subunit A